MLERNLKQAEVPDNCVVLHNARGTAPGMLFKKTIKAAVSHVQLTASPNPSEGGDLDAENSGIRYGYQTSDTVGYGYLKNFAKKNKENPTLAEAILWKELRGKKLDNYKFRRQHIIGSFIADFVCISKKLIIEIDGLIHQHPDNKLSDAARTIELNQSGFKVLRFSNDEVVNETERVLNKIILSLSERNKMVAGSENPPLEGREAIYISLPGVPHEMKGLITSQVVPYLISNFTMPAIIHRTAFTAGQGESMLAEMLKDFEPTLPQHIKLAYLPNYGMVKLRLTAKGDNKEKTEAELTPYFEKLKELVKDYLVTDRDEGLEIVIGQLLKARGKTMATAESCTGGTIAHLITAVPGSSAYYKGSVVSYANELKENILGVKQSTLRDAGAVSEATVREMVTGALKAMNVDFAVATSGIMGPDGGTPEKPVGTVWIAAGNLEKIETLKLNLRFDRQRNIGMTAANALNFLRKFILANS